MSISELIVILIVAIFVIKPEDIVTLLRKARQIKVHISSFRNNIINYLAEVTDVNEKHDDITDDKDEINLYMQKISALGESYNGNYSSHEVRQAYHKLLFEIAAKEKAKGNENKLPDLSNK
ncbi:MAG: hypothetical protein EOP33_02230 [Rickettsiaceae bacterium]|nr:MAG: hypothetical protein EOP33_02230 [Rickettsiaceae bacterium]